MKGAKPKLSYFILQFVLNSIFKLTLNFTSRYKVIFRVGVNIYMLQYCIFVCEMPYKSSMCFQITAWFFYINMIFASMIHQILNATYEHCTFIYTLCTCLTPKFQELLFIFKMFMFGILCIIFDYNQLILSYQFEKVE